MDEIGKEKNEKRNKKNKEGKWRRRRIIILIKKDEKKKRGKLSMKGKIKGDKENGKELEKDERERKRG